MRALILATQDLRLTLRDRSSIFWIFLAPAIWVALFGFINRPQNPDRPRVGLTIIQQDGSVAADRLVSYLEGGNIGITHIAPGSAEPGEPDAARRLTIPPGFGEAIEARRKISLELKERAGSSPEGDMAVKVAVHKAIIRLLADESFGSAGPAGELVTVRGSWAGGRTTPAGLYQTIPGNLVMFVLLSTMTYGAALLAQERKAGLLRRLSSSVTTRREILAGKLLGRVGVAGVQVLVFILMGLLIFRFDWGGSPAGLALLLICFILCAAAFGLMAGALFKSPEAASGIGVVLTLAMSALGGCWWPAEINPAWLQQAAWAFPTSWAMNGLNELLSWGGGLRDVAVHCLVLALFAAAAGTVAVGRLKVV
ncbi:MAG TPA: ABC transporter permease [Candidatus Polarisedimenticolia bacterium]|nr:ABC transporter permease [Candidatus Polarisedimenticolia bacterium]